MTRAGSSSRPRDGHRLARDVTERRAAAAAPCFSGAGAVVPPHPLLEPLHPATPDAATRIAVIAATVLNRIVSPPIVGYQTGDRARSVPLRGYTATGSTPATHSSTAARSGPQTNTTSVLRRCETRPTRSPEGLWMPMRAPT